MTSESESESLEAVVAAVINDLYELDGDLYALSWGSTRNRVNKIRKKLEWAVEAEDA